MALNKEGIFVYSLYAANLPKRNTHITQLTWKIRVGSQMEGTTRTDSISTVAKKGGGSQIQFEALAAAAIVETVSI